MKEIGYYRQGDMCTFTPDQEEYRLLEELADKLTKLSPNGFKYWVGDTYLDYGSGWKWTTVLSEDTVSPYFQSTYQAISPAEWLALMNGEDITYIAEHVLNDKYCPDRIKACRNLNRRRSINASTSLDKKYRGIWWGAQKNPMTVKELLDKIGKSNGRGFFIKTRMNYKSDNLFDDGVTEVFICDESGRGRFKLDQDCIDYLYDILSGGYLKEDLSKFIR